MKPISTLSLYIFLSLTSAVPIVPERERCTQQGLCKSYSKPTFAAVLSVFHLKHTSSQKEPHFPKHQLTVEEILEIPSSGVHPPITIPPSEALAIEVPIESSFLLNLPKSKEEQTLSSPTHEIPAGGHSSKTEALPSAPTSALPELRAEEARKLGSSLLHSIRQKKTSGCSMHAKVSADVLKQEEEMISIRNKLQRALLSTGSLAVTPQEIDFQFTKLEKKFPTLAFSTIHRTKIDELLKKIANKKDMVLDEEFRFTGRARTLLISYDRMVGAQRRKEAVHGDVLVVGIVMLFVIAVVIVELADLALSSIKSFLGFHSGGAIRLVDDDELAMMQPFRLMPAPKGRRYSLEKICEEV